jgi:predicted nucleic acid-binding protein
VKKAYFDSSAIIKLGHLEPESHALIDYLGQDQLSLATSIIADVEVRRTLSRLRAVGADPDEHVRGFFLLDLSRDVRDRAVELGSSVLRSIDAIHVASALTIEADIDFVTYDTRQAAAARDAGLRVVQPGRTGP